MSRTLFLERQIWSLMVLWIGSDQTRLAPRVFSVVEQWSRMYWKIDSGCHSERGAMMRRRILKDLWDLLERLCAVVWVYLSPWSQLGAETMSV